MLLFQGWCRGGPISLLIQPYLLESRTKTCYIGTTVPDCIADLPRFILCYKFYQYYKLYTCKLITATGWQPKFSLLLLLYKLQGIKSTYINVTTGAGHWLLLCGRHWLIQALSFAVCFITSTAVACSSYLLVRCRYCTNFCIAKIKSAPLEKQYYVKG
jgi:hypothetical protein